MRALVVFAIFLVLIAVVLAVSEECYLSPVAGPCRNYVNKWYFDTDDDECKPFWYGGCDGNENRFDSLESCMSNCYPRY